MGTGVYNGIGVVKRNFGVGVADVIFSRLSPVGFVLGSTDQGLPRRISRWTAGVPPLIYAMPLRVFIITGSGHHDSPFDLPAVVRGGPAPNQVVDPAGGGTTPLLGLPDI